MPSTNLANRPDFQRVIATHEFSTGEYQAGESGTKPSLLFGSPVVDEQGQLTRVIYAAMNLDVLGKTAAEARLPEGGSIDIFDRGGHILARFPEPEKWIGRSIANSALAHTVMSKEEGTVQARDVDNIERLCAFTKVRPGPNAGLFVVVGIPTELAFHQINHAMARNLIILIGVALLALLAAWSYASSYILDPVKSLVAATKRLASGDLSARAGTIASSGEFNELTQAFDDMAANLQRQRLEIEESEREIRALNATLEQRVQERTESLKESNTDLEAFSYSISHDLRAPLRHIHGYSEMLHQDFSSALGENGRPVLDRIIRATRRMDTLIEDLLSFSRLNKTEMRRIPVKMDNLVTEVIREMESDLQGRTIQWKIDPLPQVEGDPPMLKLVWTNLLGNAVKYTRHRERAQIEINCIRKGSSEWQFSVRDNGAGFSMEYAGKLFMVFQRLHSEKEFEGIGIGLANVRRIIQRHGGKIWAEGQVNQGATFYFTLPA